MNRHPLVVVSLALLCQLMAGCVALPSAAPGGLLGDQYIDDLASGYFERRAAGAPAPDPTGIETFRKRYAAHVVDGELSEARLLRNDVAHDLLSVSDAMYSDFREGLYNGYAGFNTAFEMLDLALTGTSAAIGGEAAKTALSAAATFLQGSHTSVVKNFYAEKTISALVLAMDGERARLRSEIVERLGFAVDEYTLAEVLSDIQAYHRAGSIVTALVKLNEAASAQAMAGETALVTKQAERAADSERVDER